MANNKQHIEPDYNALLRKYMDGSISKEERFVLEKAALDNPFIGDALEGFHIDGKNHQVALDRINAGVQKNAGNKASVFSIRTISAIAASLLLFGVISLWIINDRKLNESQDLVMQEKAISQEDGIVPIAANESINEEETEAGYVMDESKKEKDHNTTQVEIPAPKVQTTAESSTPESSIPESPTASSLKIEAVPEENVVDVVDMKNKTKEVIESPSTVIRATDAMTKAEEVIVLEEEDDVEEDQVLRDTEMSTSYKAKKRNERKTTQAISGSVYTASNELIIGAMINFLDQDTAVLTDINGTFSFLPKKYPVAIDASYTGFLSVAETIEGPGPVVIVLEEAQDLSEIVVTSAPVNSAKPMMGDKNFEEYIKDNKFTSVAEKKTMVGSVLVGFTIKPNGEIVNIRVISSDCPSCRERAKELLENSGKWVNDGNYDINTTFLIQF